MSFMIAIAAFTAVAATWAFISGYRSAGPARSSPKYDHYKCRHCGADVVTADRLDGKCDRCWAQDFESASERMDREFP